MRSSSKAFLYTLLIMFGAVAIVCIVLSLFSGCGGSKIEFVEGKPVLVFKDGASTPYVGLGDRFMTQNTKPTTIKGFAGGGDLKTISILFGDNRTILSDTTRIHLMGRLSFAPLKGNSITLVKTNDIWVEVSRNLK